VGNRKSQQGAQTVSTVFYQKLIDLRPGEMDKSIGAKPIAKFI
jgi:hypothetical protein